MVMCVDCHTLPVFVRGRCRRCYEGAARRGAIHIWHAGGATQCSVPGCATGGLLRRGLCPMHYTRWKRYGDTADRWPKRCAVEGCEHSGPFRRGRCSMHYTQWQRSNRGHLL